MNCSGCYFSRALGNWLTCHVTAPLGMPMPGNDSFVSARWPVVQPEDWCGEWKQKAKPKAVGGIPHGKWCECDACKPKANSAVKECPNCTGAGCDDCKNRGYIS